MNNAIVIFVPTCIDIRQGDICIIDKRIMSLKKLHIAIGTRCVSFKKLYKRYIITQYEFKKNVF